MNLEEQRTWLFSGFWRVWVIINDFSCHQLQLNHISKYVVSPWTTAMQKKKIKNLTCMTVFQSLFAVYLCHHCLNISSNTDLNIPVKKTEQNLYILYLWLSTNYETILNLSSFRQLSKLCYTISRPRSNKFMIIRSIT